MAGIQSLIDPIETEFSIKYSHTFKNDTLFPSLKVKGTELFCPPFINGDSNRINFIESSGEECLTSRQACSVEAAARQNYQMSIKVHRNVDKTISSPSWDANIIRPGRMRSCIFNRLLSDSHQFPNIEFISQNFTLMLHNSIFRPLLNSIRENHSWSLEQTSYAIGLLMLHENGGFYLDFDDIVLRQLHCLRNAFSYFKNKSSKDHGMMVIIICSIYAN